MSKFLIVTADDFGIHEAVNQAVSEAHTTGILTAASLMVGAAAADDAIRRARELPNLRVGLHLVLADGHAVLPRREIPDLVDADGRFGDGMWLDGVRYFALPALRRQLEAEIRAQFAAFARTGLALDHVNAHKHFHLHPTLLAMIVRIGREFGVRAIRVPDEPLWFARRGTMALGTTAGATFLMPWVALMKARLRGAGIAHNDRVFGIASTGQFDESTLLHILERLPSGITEIYLHPAARAAGPISASMADYRHTAELEALVSSRVAEAAAASGAALGGYRDIRRQ
ncbi:MAG TPA: hopanoid biosynthesis-associated protein HpnK [Steroidobacteraceae bacterium]|nr:hopanoid biosynthesis-associated protein HpnK [Steroidobacteraceae bacterium]